jgi:hypothetical protein
MLIGRRASTQPDELHGSIARTTGSMSDDQAQAAICLVLELRRQLRS